MKLRKTFLVIVVLSVMFLSPYAFAEKGTEIVLKSDEWSVSIYPRSLQVTAKPDGENPPYPWKKGFSPSGLAVT